MRLVRASLDTFILRNESLLIAQSLLLFLFGTRLFGLLGARWVATATVAICGLGLVLWTATAYVDGAATVVVKKVHVLDVDKSHDIATEVQ
jgi:hypothetical protein